MVKPAVILASHNAREIALRRPDAFVVDHERFCVWRGEHSVTIGTMDKRTKLFTLFVMCLCARNCRVDHEDIWVAFYRRSVGGGPDDFLGNLYVLIGRLSDAFLWAGLTVRSRHGYHDLECRRLPVDAPDFSMQVFTGGQSRPLRLPASSAFLEAAE